MQDIHFLTGGGTPAAARLFSAAAAAAATAGDRHLRPLHPNNQALKCPRCDSLNTKFCYYNNYNLSQPRHFCKSCRRYWTKGGVLRNVPVGGGCRKSRHSNSSSSSKPTASPSPSAPKPKPQDDSATTSAANNNNNHSSSDSSTLTAAATAERPTLFHEYGSSCPEKPSTGTAKEAMDGSVNITINQSMGVWIDDVSTSELTEIGNFPGLMGSTAEITPFVYAGVLSQVDQPQQQQQQQGMVVVEGFGPLDWQGGGSENNGVDGGEGLFEMTGDVDPAYWSQPNQWTPPDVEVDHHQHGRGGHFLP